jgi:DNA-binding XRE family transcriptional regulator
MTFPNRLRQLRAESHLTQKQLAQKIGVCKQTIIWCETGRSAPTVFNLECLADFFGVSTDYLLGRSEKRNG